MLKTDSMTRPLDQRILFSGIFFAAVTNTFFNPVFAEQRLLLDQAALMAKNGKVEKAKLTLESYLKREPRSARAWYLLGCVKQDMAVMDGTIKAARICYLKSLSIDSNFSDAYRKLGELAGIEGNWQEEIRLCDRALACNKPDQRSYIARAIAKSNLHQDKEALADYEKFRAALPDLASTPRVLDEYATFLENAGQCERAIKILQSLEKIDNRPSLPVRRAKLCAKVGKSLEGIAILSKMIAAQPEDETLYSDRARLLVKTGKLKEGWRDLDEAIRLEPTSQYYLERAALMEKLGYKDKAKADREKAQLRN